MKDFPVPVRMPKRLLKKTKKMQAIIWTGHEKSLGSQEIGQTSRPVEMEATNKI